MLKAIKVRIAQGKQTIPDVRTATSKGFRGFPIVGAAPCVSDCTACRDICPTSAITINPLRIDLGKCIFCGECERVCPPGKILFTEAYKMASDSRESLLIGESVKAVEVKAQKTFRKLFGRSLKLRSVSAGGCNGCELELNALSNVNFDIGRFGIDFVASPRHADGLVISGPLTKNMSRALALAFDAMPEPKFIIATGACTLSGGIYESSAELSRDFLDRHKPALYIPGCPPHPLTFVNGILDLLGRRG